jgi:hypothetical protein
VVGEQWRNRRLHKAGADRWASGAGTVAKLRKWHNWALAVACAVDDPFGERDESFCGGCLMVRRPCASDSPTQRSLLLISGELKSLL